MKVNTLKTKTYTGIIALGFMLLPILSWAQEAEFKAEVIAPETKLTLLELLKQGGWSMIPLALFSIAVVSLSVRNYMILQKDKMLRPDLQYKIQQLLAEGDIESVINMCNAQPTMATTVLKAGMEHITTEDLDIEAVQNAIGAASRAQVATHMKPINYLSNFGAISPMVGLLGTVSGMIKAFQAIGQGGMGKPEVLAANIGEALITTATGLVIAIPAMLAYYYFKNTFSEIVGQLGQYMAGYVNTLNTGEVTTVSTEE